MSRYKVIFTKPKDVIPFNNQKMINSFIHKTIGHNGYHDTFSEYNISGLQGGKYDAERGGLVYEEPYIIISSPNEEFNMMIIEKLLQRKQMLFGMTVADIRFVELGLNAHYDYISTLSPIIVFDKKSRRKITFKDEGWIDMLRQNCIDKLRHMGIEDKTFSIEAHYENKWKTKMVYVGDVYNVCSMVKLKVSGSIGAREILYNLGLGGSCGSGFGCVKIVGSVY